MAILAKKTLFLTPGGSKRGEIEFLGKKRKRHSLTFPNTKLHAKNQKNRGRETDRQTDRDRPEYKGPPDAIAKSSDQKESTSMDSLLLSTS